MRASAKNILSYLNSNFEKLELLFDASRKTNYILESSIYEKLLNEQSLKENDLYHFLFIKQQPDGSYKLEKGYTDFFEFLSGNTTLVSSEVFKGYIDTINKLFLSLQTAQKEDEIKLQITSLIETINDFAQAIDAQTNQLLKDTEALKHDANDKSDLAERVQKANFWVDKFINPLNEMLDRQKSNSIMVILAKITKYANYKQYNDDNADLRKLYNRLLQDSERVEENLRQQSQRIVRELLPLLERIRDSSTILSGFYHILEDEEKNNTTIVALPNLVTQKHRRSYSNSWKAKVDLLLDVLAQESKPQEFESEETEKDDWIPDTLTFKDALRKDLPVANFYQWCYDYLNQQGTIITQNKYFIVTNLLLDDDIKADFQNLTINVNDRDKDIYHFESIMKFEIELQDASLTLPIIAAYGIS